MNSNLDLSIVVVSHNHASFVRKCLHSAFGQRTSLTWELVVIDNTGRDGLPRSIPELWPTATVVVNDSPCGYAANANKGSAIARCGRYLLMLNPDVTCCPGLFNELVRFMDDNPDVGVAGPMLLNEDGSVQRSRRALPTLAALALRWSRADRLLPRSKALRKYLLLDSPDREPADVDWVTGAVQIVRREAAESVGPMDERYFLYWEDLDWCIRMWDGGWRVCYVPAAQAVHVHMRAGVRRPFSQAGRAQLTSLWRLYVKFGFPLPARRIRERQERFGRLAEPVKV
jgi:N-acetylglucosaminyl-diphospho-decaprenol L-rhamnosyltransferase